MAFSDVLELEITNIPNETITTAVETTTITDENTAIFENTTSEESTKETIILKSIIPTSTSSSSNKGLIIGLLMGGIAFITGIIISIILFKKQNSKNRIKKNKKLNDIMKTINELKIMELNKEKADNLIKELNSYVKSYNKNLIKNCSKCIICDEDFIDKSSIVITTKCGHTFHRTCINNYIKKNYESPKCPICKILFLGLESNFPISSMFTYSNKQVNQINHFDQFNSITNLKT